MNTKKTIFAYSPFSGNKTLYINLAWRILLLCLLLAGIPLSMYSLLLYRRISTIKQQEAFIELKLLTDEQNKGIEKKIAYANQRVREIKNTTKYFKDPQELSELYEGMSQQKELILLVHSSPKGWITIASSETSLKNQAPPCDPLSKECVWQGKNVLLFTDSLDETQKILLFVPLEEIVSLVEYKIGEHGVMSNQVMLKKDLSSYANTSHSISLFTDDSLSQLSEGKWIPKIPKSVTKIGTAIPIGNTAYAMVIEMPLFIELVQYHFWHLLIIICLLFLFIGGAIVFWLTHKMAEPLVSLARVMHRIEEGHLHSRYQQRAFGFELNVLGNQLNHMLETLKQSTEEKEKQRIAKELLAKELAIGHAIQKNLFPNQLPNLPQLDIATVFYPALKVAGDFYDLFQVGKHLLIVMADASGAGIPACLFSLSLRGMLRSLAESGKPLEQIVKIAHKLLIIDSQENCMFITLWIGMLDLETLNLSYLSLGHYPAIMRRGSVLKELDSQGSALGIETEKPFVLEKIQLAHGDLLFLYTDGLIEALKRDNQKALDLLKQIDIEAATSDILTQITPLPPYEDDLTLMLLKISKVDE